MRFDVTGYGWDSNPFVDLWSRMSAGDVIFSKDCKIADCFVRLA
jgi:hypothetical protein